MKDDHTPHTLIIPSCHLLLSLKPLKHLYTVVHQSLKDIEMVRNYLVMQLTQLAFF